MGYISEFNLFVPLMAMFFENALLIVPIIWGLLAFRILLPRLKGAAGEAMVGKTLDGLFGDVLHDNIVADGRGGFTPI